MFVTFYITNMNENVPCMIFFPCSKKHPYCTTLLLQSPVPGGALTGFSTRWLYMGSTTKV